MTRCMKRIDWNQLTRRPYKNYSPPEGGVEIGMCVCVRGEVGGGGLPIRGAGGGDRL